ncbi:hypothetical protein P3S67_029943 [Capsicum chacoense]
MNIALSYEQDHYFGQTSQFGSMKNAETFSNVHGSSSFGATEYYRVNITQDQHNVHKNIDNVDQPNYRSSSQSESDYLPNAEESDDKLPFVASSSDDEFMTPNRSTRPMSMSPTHVEELLPPQNLHLVVRSPSVHIPEFYQREISYLHHPLDGPDVFMNTHGDKCTSQGTWHEP